MQYDERKIVALTTKQTQRDENGFMRYIWATEDEMRKLLDAQFDEERRNYVYMLGDKSVRPCDIIEVKVVKIKEAKNWPAFNKTVYEKLLLEDGRKQKELEPLKPMDKDNLEKLEKMKAQHNLLSRPI